MKLASSSIIESVESQKQCVHQRKLLLCLRETLLTSIQRRPQQLSILETSLRRILHKCLGIMPHKVQLVQELKLIDHPMRFCFAKWARDRLADADFGKKKSSLQMKHILILEGMETSKI